MPTTDNKPIAPDDPDLVWLWVPIIGNGTAPTNSREMSDAEGPYRPAIPPGIPFTSDDSFVVDQAARPSRPVNGYAHVGVRAEDVPKIVRAVPEAQVPLLDRKATEMVRRCRGKWDEEAEKFFDSLPPMRTESERQAARKLLQVAIWRGLSPARARRVEERLSL